MKGIAILGAKSQLGRTLKDLTENEPDKYVFYSKQDVDITNINILGEAFNNQKFDFCINCAAFTDVEEAEKDIATAYLVNAEGVKNVAEVCNTFGIKLIHISTDYVFDGTKNHPYSTYDDTNPINQYGKSKLKGELCIKEKLKQYYIIRTSWLYSIYGKNFLKTIINKIEKNEKLKITTEEKGTPTSVIDLAGFILFIIKSNAISYGTYNFSARGSTTWCGFAREIIENYYPQRIKNISATANFKTLAKRPKYSVLDNSKTERVYKPLNEWKKSVKTLVNLYKAVNTKD